MDSKQKKMLKKIIALIFKGEIEDILDRKVAPLSRGSHIIIPIKYKNKRVKVVVYKK